MNVLIVNDVSGHEFLSMTDGYGRNHGITTADWTPDAVEVSGDPAR